MPVAVIDIGANAIRVSIYSENTIGSPEIYSCKLKNTIARLLQEDEIDSKHASYLSIRYILDVCSNFEVSKIKCVATAILRDHPKASEFVRIIKEKFDLDIQILSGKEEAIITATGLISGSSDASGIAVDLGGGSLELAEVRGNDIGRTESIDLGTKVISTSRITDSETITSIIREKFADQNYKNLYLIGGAFRSIGKNFMEYYNLPLRNLHNLEIERLVFSGFIEKIGLSESERSSFYSRIQYNAVLVAKALINIFNFDKICISNYGLKEGVRFNLLPQEEKIKNPNIEKLKYISRWPHGDDLLEKLVNIIKDLLINPDDELIEIIKLAIIMNYYGDHSHIDRFLKGDFISEVILNMDIPFTLEKRIFISLILAITYKARPGSRIFKISSRVLTQIDKINANIIANFINIILLMSGSKNPKPNFELVNINNFIEIKMDILLPRSVFSQICEHIKEIGASYKAGIRMMDKA